MASTLGSSTARPIAGDMIPPDPEEFFSDHLVNTYGSHDLPQGARCVCPLCQDLNGSLYRIDICGHHIHRKCIAYWFTRLHSEKNACPECKTTLIQDSPLLMKNIAEKEGVTIEKRTLSPPVTKFGRSHLSVEDLHKTEKEVIVTIIESYLSHEIKKAKKDRKPNYVTALDNMTNKMDEIGLPLTDYMPVKEHFRAGIADHVVRRLKKLYPESVGTKEFAALWEEVIDIGDESIEQEDSEMAALVS